MAEPARWVSVPEAARLLGVSENTVRRRIKGGALTGEVMKRPQGDLYQVRVPDGLVRPVDPNEGGSEPPDPQHPATGTGPFPIGEATVLLVEKLEAARDREVALARRVGELEGVGRLLADQLEAEGTARANAEGEVRVLLRQRDLARAENERLAEEVVRLRQEQLLLLDAPWHVRLWRAMARTPLASP